MKSCPHCSLENPDSAQRCDCGWDFTSSRMKPSLLPGSDLAIKRKTPIWMIFLPEIVLLPIALLVWSVEHPYWVASVVLLAITISVWVLKK
jgi:hypothetical protein